MRTTLTLENDLAEKLRELAHQQRASFKKVVNQTLRIGLAARAKPESRTEPFHVEPSHCGFRPGIDAAKLNQIVDETEADDFRSKGGA